MKFIMLLKSKIGVIFFFYGFLLFKLINLQLYP